MNLSNEKTITSGGFGFQDRLKSFLTKTSNHTNSFDWFLNYIKYKIPEAVTSEELIKKDCDMR